MDWIASILLWIGNIVLIRKKSWIAFVIYFMGNILWLIYWIPRKEWAAAILVGTFMAQNIWGILSWRKNESRTT